ncbi:signal peptidase II [Roseovarius sp. LXJ103]|uniref:signal peptidase II n=1 Tax=Roseovarius carneus TaxID=2853164 RepID=UPI000D60AD96|nr:signal peptidase II [Roseovarius carneus]MBZ8117864.1 signal peptidase II [Roseovarius carneus]PWE36376.1 signal peptidase II [Pelagicola sp. LXJ1103]
MRTLAWVAVIIFVVDQVSKYYIIHMLDLATVRAIDVWPPYLNLRMAWNYGINFGLLATDSDVTRWVLIIVALIISGAVIWWIRHEPGGIWQNIAAGFLVGGALGNVVDRVWYGAVADFLNMSCCGFTNPYAFNVADISIFIGAFGLVIFTPDKKPA